MERVTVESVIESWKSDSVIDPSELGSASLYVEQVFDKYKKMWAQARRRLRQAEAQLKRLRLEKYEFLTMGPSAESQARGWRLPPRGRVLKNEAWMYVDADPEVIALALEAGEAEDVVDAVTEKLKLISFRGNRVRDAIDWQKFIHGR